jgi:hypothetical protein
MRDSQESTRPRHMDKLGTLCHQGLDIASYLFQVPDDESEREKLRLIVEAIGQDPLVKGRREFPLILAEMRETLAGPGTPMSAEALNDGFERMVKLWHTTRSGLF